MKWTKAGKGGKGKNVQKFAANFEANGGRVYITFYDDEGEGTDGLFSDAPATKRPKLSAKEKRLAKLQAEMAALEADE